MAYEAARILHHLGCDVRVYDPTGLPMKDESSTTHPKVQELRELTTWSQAHFWCSPEQHGNITAVMKNQSELFGWSSSAGDWKAECSSPPQSTGSHSRSARFGLHRARRLHSHRLTAARSHSTRSIRSEFSDDGCAWSLCRTRWVGLRELEAAHFRSVVDLSRC